MILKKMERNCDFTFKVWLSKESYKSKPVSTDYSRMSWDETELTVAEFIDRIVDGYSYCHLFYGTRRLKTSFKCSQVVSIDVDDTTTSLREFLADVALKPTFAYETFSNGKDGLYSYRLVFIIKEPLCADDFQQMYMNICLKTGLTSTKDHCGKTLTQLMNGTTHDAYVYKSYNIYSTVTDLPVNTDELLKLTGIIPKVNPIVTIVNQNQNQVKNKGNNFSNNYNNIKYNHKQYKSKEPYWKNILSDFQEAMDTLAMGRRRFLETYHAIFPKLIRWSHLTFNDSGYCVIPDDHLSLYVRYGYINGENVVNRFRDGEKRRNRLFIDGCIIRKIKPDITTLEMLYNLVHRVYHYYDNSDYVLTDELLLRKAFDVMTADIDSMEFVSLDAGRITTSAAYCRRNNISRRSHSRKAMMIENYAGIREWYDESLSVIENLRNAEKSGIDISRSTLKRYCKYNGISMSPRKTDISTWYQPTLSVKQNLQYA